MAPNRALKEIRYAIAGGVIGVTADIFFRNNPELSGELKLVLATEVHKVLLGIPTETFSVAAGTIGWGILRTAGLIINLLARSMGPIQPTPRHGEYLTFDEAITDEAHEYALEKSGGDMGQYARYALEYLEEHDPNPPPNKGRL